MAHAQHTPNIQPTLDLPVAAGPIEIDGELDDPGWAGAARAQNFTETWPGDNQGPDTQTEAWITWDEENFYFAMKMEDDPTKLRASLRDRDEIWSDDYVGLLLDPYDSAQWAYEFFINPLGVQGDLRWTTNGEDMGFDLVWSSEAKITDTGWQIEVAIPFSSLRFPDQAEQNWRANFWRNRPRDSRERNSWAQIDRDDPCWTCQWGTLTGIREVDPGKGVLLLPSLVASQSSARQDGSLQSLGEDAEFGLGARYALNSSFAAEGTLNPDFSQIESDAAQLDVNSTFALSFPERRPFFQEGSDLFRSWVNAIYTRTINDPLVATKLTGRSGRKSLAVLGAWDETTPILIPGEEGSQFRAGEGSFSTVLRGRTGLRRDDHLGFLLTNRWLEGGTNNTVFGLDGQFRLSDLWRVEAQSVFSHTSEADSAGMTAGLDDVFFDNGKYTAAFDGESFDGLANYLSLERDGNSWRFDMDLWTTSPSFRADNGFVPSNNQIRNSWYSGYAWKPDSRVFDEINLGLSAARIWNFDGLRKDEWIRPSISASFKKQTRVELSVMTSNERFRGNDFRGMQRASLYINSDFSEPLQLGTYLDVGKSIARNLEDPELGHGYTWELWGGIKPIQRLIIGPSITFARLEDQQTGEAFFDGKLWRVRSSLQFNRQLFLRVVLQYNGFREQLSVEPLLSYKLNPFSVFFLGSSVGLERRDGLPQESFVQQDRQFFMKFQYLLGG